MNLNFRLRHCAAVAATALLLLITSLIAAGESSDLQQGGGVSGPATNSIFTWDSISQSTNVSAMASEASFIFHFTNVTSGKIVINDVLTSCGCTTVEIPSLPWMIGAGTNGQIAVTVEIAGESGTLLKTVDVVTDKGTDVLTAEVEIIPEKLH